MFSHHPREDIMLLKEPAPRLSGEKWGRGLKGQMRAGISMIVLGNRLSQFYEFGHNKMRILRAYNN
jgi:hypothetical protein